MSIKFKEQEFTPREFNEFVNDYEDRLDDDFIAEQFEYRGLECECEECEDCEDYGIDTDKITLVQKMAYDYFVDHIENISLDDLEAIMKIKRNV